MGIVVRYPGRACLLGEHCDWAGGASLAVPVPLGVEIAVEAPVNEGILVRSALEGELLSARFPTGGRVDRNGGPLRFVGAAARLLQDEGIPIPSVELWVTADLPAGRGFSSSAAFCLAVLDALSRAAGQPLGAEPLAELAYRVEHDLLGIDCGRLDPLACVAGAPVFLRWADGRAPLRRLRPERPLHLVLGAFCQPRDTAGILSVLQQHHGADLRQRGELDPAAIQAVREALSTFASLAETGTRALENGELAELGAAMDAAQEAYERMSVRLPPLRAPGLRSACAALRGAGAWGAKFSGAGGDGSVIALFPDSEGASRGAGLLRDRGLSAWSFVLEDA